MGDLLRPLTVLERRQMDILNFNTRFGKGIVSKLLSSFFSKKLGYKVKLDLSKLHIKNDGRTLTITFAGEATAPTESIKF